MTQEKTLQDCYKIVLREFDYFRFSGTGICDAMYSCWYKGLLTDEEHSLLIHHFRDNKPTVDIHNEFYSHDSYYRDGYSNFYGYWWNTEDKEQRKLFLRKLIKELNARDDEKT